VRHAITFLATGAYVGLIPIAPGTFGSVLALPLLVAIAALRLSPSVVVLAIVAVAALAMLVCERAGALYEDADSSRIVLDEVCGMLVAGALLPPTPRVLLLAFVLFRVFDIVKPFPARYLDRQVRNGFGVVADDLVAGLYANLVVRVLT
jgi:phosphatidylglycerophosphatase A